MELQYDTKYFVPVTYQWSYSDGNGSGPVHVFSKAGTYQVNCTVTSYIGSFTNSTSVTVEDGMLACNYIINYLLKSLAVYGLRFMAAPSVAAVNQPVHFSVIKVRMVTNVLSCD